MNFQEWLDEVEVFSTRSERLRSEFSDLSKTDFVRLLEWLNADWGVGHDHGMTHDNL